MQIFLDRHDVVESSAEEGRRPENFGARTDANDVLQLREATSPLRRPAFSSCQWRSSAPDKLESAFDTLQKDGVEALLVPPDTTFYSRRRQIAELAATTRLPAIYGYRDHVEEGGLMSYGPDIP